jgi:hypothetical protein
MDENLHYSLHLSPKLRIAPHYSRLGCTQFYTKHFPQYSVTHCTTIHAPPYTTLNNAYYIKNHILQNSILYYTIYYTALHYTSQHCPTLLRYKILPYTNVILHNTTQHYTMHMHHTDSIRNYTTLHHIIKQRCLKPQRLTPLLYPAPGHLNQSTQHFATLHCATQRESQHTKTTLNYNRQHYRNPTKSFSGRQVV